MLIMIVGAVSLALWMNFNKATRGRHASNQGLPLAVNLLWLIVSLLSVVFGYIFLVVG